MHDRAPSTRQSPPCAGRRRTTPRCRRGAARRPGPRPARPAAPPPRPRPSAACRHARRSCWPARGSSSARAEVEGGRELVRGPIVVSRARSSASRATRRSITTGVRVAHRRVQLIDGVARVREHRVVDARPGRRRPTASGAGAPDSTITPRPSAAGPGRRDMPGMVARAHCDANRDRLDPETRRLSPGRSPVGKCLDASSAALVASSLPQSPALIFVAGACSSGAEQGVAEHAS